MDYLPSELILMILNKLDSLDDLLECRLVCRRWNELVKLIRIQNLQLGRRCRLAEIGWQFDLFSIDSNPTLFKAYGINFIISNLIKTAILSRLKQLSFDSIQFSSWISFEKSLQQLSELENLEIGTLFLDKEGVLNLPNLRMLSIYSLYRNYRIILDLPKLSKLLIAGGFNGRCQFLHPTSVTHLALGNTYVFSSYLDEFVEQFQECQYLHLTDRKYNLQLSFINLPKLKEIHCYTLNKIDILNLIKELNVSRMLNFIRIYFNGFSANDLDEVEELFDNADRFILTTQRIVSNYHRLPRCVLIAVHLDYNQLVRHFNNRLPSDLHTKLINIRKLLVIGNVDDQAKLLRFIGKLKWIKMEIKFTSLNQSSYFYENLHLYWNRGNSLRIEEQPGVITNLDFIIDLDNLSEFSINQQMPYELIERLFNQLCGYMKLEFFLNDQPIRIVLNKYHSPDIEFHVQIAEQKYTYTKDKFLDGLKQVFGI